MITNKNIISHPIHEILFDSSKGAIYIVFSKYLRNTSAINFIWSACRTTNKPIKLIKRKILE